MTPPAVNVHDVTQAIQLALGPAFLLVGIGAMLNVITGRLARVIDRGRALAKDGMPHDADARALVASELHSLDRRRHWASAAINACTLAALLACVVIAVLFIEVMLAAPLEWLIGTLFAASVVALIAGLSFFLVEVHCAKQSVRIPM